MELLQEQIEMLRKALEAQQTNHGKWHVVTAVFGLNAFNFILCKDSTSFKGEPVHDEYPFKEIVITAHKMVFATNEFWEKWQYQERCLCHVDCLSFEYEFTAPRIEETKLILGYVRHWGDTEFYVNLGPSQNSGEEPPSLTDTRLLQ